MLKRITLICWAICVLRIGIPACLVVKDRIRSAESGHVPDTEFVYFYSMGRLFNEYPPDQVYNYATQRKVCMEVRPSNNGQYGPNPFHPLLGVFFRPFARMTFSEAYLLWLCISLCLYMWGLVLFMRRAQPDDSAYRWLISCSAACSMPFIWTVLGGQVSMIGFFALALAFHEEYAERPILSGLALSVCLYKPTLLVLFLPMLVVTRRYKTLLGFAVGAGVLAVLATAAEGIRVWPGYFRLLLSFAGGVAGNQTRSAVATIWYYADVVSFFTQLPGGRSLLGFTALLVCAGSVAWMLFRAWRSSPAEKPAQVLVWSATITWTLVLNVYIPIYDSVLLVLSVIATIGVVKPWPDKQAYRWLMLLWILTLAFSWVTVQVAQSTRIQLVTLLFSAIGMLQLAALRSMRAAGSDTVESAEPAPIFVV